MVPTPPEPAWIGTFCPPLQFDCFDQHLPGRQATKGMEAASSMLRFSGFSAIESSVMQIRPLLAVAIDKECLHDDLALGIVKLE